MGSIIYYFSATGNSLAIARQIGKRLGNCVIRSMAAEPSDEPVGGPESIGRRILRKSKKLLQKTRLAVSLVINM